MPFIVTNKMFLSAKSLARINLILLFAYSTLIVFAGSNVLALASPKPKVDNSGAFISTYRLC